ncbi:hypothetical protein CGLO_18314 [Colletotrichum gloeosporioides Cg-14]|uniref:Uncharacterized protein n=1 Tax=Colletotrichum gloeosporioides (strain Cg-14) TaxID=1237896 RepID=T0JUS3_COLGC|nr:hypothetical protein CGLO_18314 [Colletotrichum gloeosporioides Cg-14]
MASRSGEKQPLKQNDSL